MQFPISKKLRGEDIGKIHRGQLWSNFLIREASSIQNVHVIIFVHRNRSFANEIEKGGSRIYTYLLCYTEELSRGFPLAYPNVRGCRKHERLRIADTVVLKLLLVDEGWRISRGNSARTATTRRGCSFVTRIAPIDRTIHWDSRYLREYPQGAFREKRAIYQKKSDAVVICACISFISLSEKEREKKAINVGSNLDESIRVMFGIGSRDMMHRSINLPGKLSAGNCGSALVTFLKIVSSVQYELLRRDWNN